MSDFLSKLTFFASSKMIHNTMNSSLCMNFTNELVEHTFDNTKTYLLYIHIPFCNEFCTFCNFHKFKYETKTAKEYFFNLRMELKKLKEKDVKFHTAYIGGGTPLIDDYELLKTLEFIKEEFNIENISCETTPNFIQKDTIQNFNGLISRLSIGVQSFNDDILKEIGRYNKYGSAKDIQEKINNIVGIIPCTSIDLIFNFPNQTKQMLIDDLQVAKNINVEQIVTYPLMSSKLRKINIFEYFKMFKNSLEYDFYKTIQDELSSYHMLNSWSFSKNIKQLSDEYVVDNNEYIGVGSGAFSYLDNQLFVNSYDLQQYKHMINNHYNANIAFTKPFKFKQKVQYLFMLHLFEGRIDITNFDKLINSSIEKVLKKEIFMLKIVDAIKIENGVIYATSYGKFLALIMMREFYSGMDEVRKKLKQIVFK